MMKKLREVDPEFYSGLHIPSRTRSGIAPIIRIPFVKKTLTRNFILNPWRHVLNAQGFKPVDENKYYYIHMNPYDAPVEPRTARAIDDVSPLLVNPDRTQFEPGAYYTYVIARASRAGGPGGGPFPIQLCATRALNMYEFGTKHQQIFYRMATSARFKNCTKYALYAAGEILCLNETTLVFNFFSGTYKMRKHIPDRRVPYEEAFITHLMDGFAPEMRVLFHHCPLILPDVVPLIGCELDRLRTHGIQVFPFDTPAQCKSMRSSALCHKNTTKNDMTVEELHKLYQQLRAAGAM